MSAVSTELTFKYQRRPAAASRGLLGVQAAARFGMLMKRRRNESDAHQYELLNDSAASFGRVSTPSQSSQVLGKATSKPAIIADERSVQDLDRELRLYAATYVAEDQWYECEKRVWFPVGPRKRVWDMIILLVLMYSIVMEPVRIGLNLDATGYFYWIEMVLSLMFAVDIIFTFNTAYLQEALEGNLWVISRGMIATNYLQGRFWLELFSAYPAELVDLLSHASLFGFESDEHTGALRAMRLLRLLRVIRVQTELKLIYGARVTRP